MKGITDRTTQKWDDKVKRLANGFRNKLGQGGYGSVYKGKLANGHLIAAKILEKSKDYCQDFINEVVVGDYVSIRCITSDGHDETILDWTPN
ncbi:G-type lectin S-receptor-like serine/threonine-protein kinase [Acorus calamus]|uniref:G-type lectin S-receptor-like serine/threonine-protein kinase n=1 Tax=Acorus calamus TaxID=4465 RepID=A0AAV9DNQ1_ACOCL|nr:G-type lectin S-receptor-like serine/threonine-protein kinase [Acorus calamus]